MKLVSAACALLVMLFVGCGKPTAPSPSASADSGASTANSGELEFWHIQTYDPTGPAVAAAVKRCTDAVPSINVVVEAIQNDAFKIKLATAMGAGSPPDLFHTWGGGILAAYAENQKVLDLTDKIADLARFHPAALEFCSVGGRLRALPVDVTVVPMWYNTKLFAQHGLEPPKTMAGFLALCETLKGKGVTPLALGNAKSWPGAFYFAYLATREGGTAPIENGAFEDPAFVAAGHHIQMLVDKGYFSKGFNGIDYDDARRAFFNGDAAMILMGPWLLAHARKEAPKFLSDIGCFAFPGLGKNPDWDRVAVGGVNAGYAVSAATKHPEAAVTLLKSLTNEQAMKDWAATGRLPALTRTAAAGSIAEDSKAVAEILFAAKKIQLYYDQYLPPELATAHKETTQALFAKNMTPEQAAAEMKKVAARQNTP